ncbi:hypothetical protein A9Q86_16320 [Flavobacteriales bacterium 33_180_T64]|nr:hypothetical protein A9Q86_16320 [Flavobacteriales bacterium 33_180_T64]
MIYLLKASAVLFIFYICYQLFLKKETFFQSNRWFLLSGLIIASCIPFVVIPEYIEYTAIDTSEFLINTSNTLVNPTEIQEEPFNYMQLIIWFYTAGLLFFFGKLAIEFLSLRKILNNASIITTSNNFKILETDEQVAAFSFFNYIVYNPNQFKSEELLHIINHEKVHTTQLHSIDTIIAQLSCIIFWFNPIVWLYKKGLQQNLEFIADQKAQHISKCDKSYQTVLLKTSIQNHQLAFTNNFYTSLIKKRIVMLHKSKSNKINQLKFILVLPLIAAFMMSFNTKDIYIEIPSEEKTNSEIITPQTENIEVVITKNTSDDDLKRMQSTLKDKGITFTYNNLKRNKKGEITSIKTSFKTKDHSTNYNVNSDNAIKAIRFKSDDHNFGVSTLDNKKGTYSFKTQDGNTNIQTTGNNIYLIEEETEENKNNTKTTINAYENESSNVLIIEEGDDPIFVVDGKIVKKSLFEDIDSDDIKSINILKGKVALESFGDKGKNGVVIMTKKGSNSFIYKTNKDTDVNVDFEFIETDGKKPLMLLNGNEVSDFKLKSMDPNSIDTIEILKGENAIKIYGDHGKDGVVLINSKKHMLLSGDNNSVLVEVTEESPYKIKTAVSSVYFTDNHNIETIEFVISKHASDSFLKKQKSNLKKHGIDVKFTKVKRNNAGEITGIKISLDDNQGRKSSASWKKKDQAIPDIVLGKSGDDKLFVRAIGH